MKANQFSELPTPAAEFLGGVVQYTGDDEDGMLKGQFYVCVSDGAVTPTYSWKLCGDLGYVTPQMYGAKGDGVTDDTDAIQAALDHGGIIYFPPGEYLITSYKYNNRDVCLRVKYDNTCIVGEKNKSIIKVSEDINTSGELLHVRPTTGNIGYFSMYNMTIRGTESFGSPQSGILLLRLWDVQNCVIK